MPGGGLARRARSWEEEVAEERSWVRNSAGIREEYWTRWRRVRSLIEGREDGSVGWKECDQSGKVAQARVKAVDWLTVEAEVARVDNRHRAVLDCELVQKGDLTCQMQYYAVSTLLDIMKCQIAVASIETKLNLIWWSGGVGVGFSRPDLPFLHNSSHSPFQPAGHIMEHSKNE